MNKPRLIDANELKEKIKEICGGQTEILIQFVEDQPTAYDIDKVVEQLEKESYDSMHIDPTIDMTKSWQIIDLEEAIEIVKGGGKRDD